MYYSHIQETQHPQSVDLKLHLQKHVSTNNQISVVTYISSVIDINKLTLPISCSIVGFCTEGVKGIMVT